MSISFEQRWFFCLYLGGAGCVFISDEELAYRQGGNSACSDAWYLDADGDGAGGDVVLLSCIAPGSEYTPVSGDCDDDDPTVSPLLPEDCNTTRDEDCDGTQNAFDAASQPPIDCLTFFTDFDGDGFGSDADTICACQADEIYSLLSGGDCNDQLATVNPNESEICGDGWDNNCDGSANGCGYTGEEVLPTIPSIIGSANQSFIGRSMEVAPLLPDHQLSIVVANNSTGSTLGRLDVFDALDLWSDQAMVSTSDSIAAITGIADADFGAKIVAGDVTGDAVTDLIVSAPSLTAEQQDEVGGWYLFEGPIRGTLNIDSALLSVQGSAAFDNLGTALSVVGTTVWAGAPGADLTDIDAGAVEVWSADGILLSQIVGSEPSMRFGESISEPSDLNGDGLVDVAVGASGANANKGAVGIFWNALDSTAQSIVDADAVWNGLVVDGAIGQQVEAIGDVTGDGRADLLIAAPNISALYVIDGAMEGPQLVDLAQATIQGNSGSALGTALAHVGDINGDEIDDIVVGDFLSSSIHIVYGPVNGLVTADDIISLQNQGSDQFGAAVAGGFDFTGDGVSDLIVGAPIVSEGYSQNGMVLMLEGIGL